MAENSAKTAKRKARGRPFAKGQSGNPGGRPKGFATLIREQTNDGAEMVAFALAVLRGKVTVGRVSMLTGESYEEGPSFKDRNEALKWLGDRGWGKAAQPVEGADGGPLVVQVVSYAAQGEADEDSDPQ